MNSTEKVCFDEIGVPVMQYAIFGNITCDVPAQGACSSCGVNATGLQPTFLLNNDYYSMESASDWEEQVFIANIKSFNHLVGYNDDLSSDQEYN